MKLMDKFQLYKPVRWNGMLLTVPVDTNYLAADASGGLFSYTYKPQRHLKSFEAARTDDHAYARIGLVEFGEGESWQDSCERVFEVPGE